MAQQIENRQRVIFVSNAKSTYNNGETSLQELSAQFPNVVFFTDDYCEELPFYDYRKVNIWKGGQPFIKVHGLASNHSVAIGETMITLTLSNDGFLGLSINSSLKNVIVLGIVPNNCVEKPETIVGSFLGDVVKTYNSRTKNDPLSSNVNQYSLLIALQTTKKLVDSTVDDGVTKQLKIINTSLINDTPSAGSAYNATFVVNGTKVGYDELKESIGLTEEQNVSEVLTVDDEFITMLQQAHLVNIPGYDTEGYQPFQIIKYPIDITKIVKPIDELFLFPDAFTVDNTTVTYKGLQDTGPYEANRNQMQISRMDIEPFFNYIRIDNWNDSNDYGNLTYKTISFDVSPCICTNSFVDGAYRLDDKEYLDFFNKFIGQTGNDYSKYFRIKNVNNNDLTLNEIREAYGKWNRRLNDISFKLAKTNKAALSFELTIPANAQTFFRETYNINGPTINIYFDTERVKDDLLGSDHIYYNVGPITISETSYRVAFVVTRNGYVNEQGYVDKELVDFINTKLAENSAIYTKSYSSFDDLTGNLSTNPNDVGEEIQLSSFYRDSEQSGGYTFIAIPKVMLNEAELAEGRSNLIISNAIRYFIDDPNYGQRFAHFALKPTLFQGVNLGIYKDNIEYILFRIDTPLSGKILLLNKQNTQIYSNNI